MAGGAQEIVSWAVRVGLDGLSPSELMAGYCDRLAQAGVPLWRASIGADTLHPLIDAQGQRWLAGEGVHEEVYIRQSPPEIEQEWLQSPWYRMLEDRNWEMRRRLAVGEGTNEFPLLAALAAQGGTDYWARIIRYGEGANIGEGKGVATSFATRDPGGFAAQQLAAIEATLPAFALAYKATMTLDTARTLVTTYLGRDASERILRGEIERGQVKTLRKVLWFSDLAGFTRIADTLAREQLLDLLNAYAEGLVGVIHDHRGEVLKFMGDGILAFFDGAAGEACERALDAAWAARAAIARLNREREAAGLPVTSFTLALHEGEVLSGNIGSQERLDFTVVGPAVNEVARIQAMSRSLDQPILVSAPFAAACGEQRARLVSLGRYALRGVGRPQELFTLDLVGPAPPGAWKPAR
jgi:adenylate cyclase